MKGLHLLCQCDVALLEGRIRILLKLELKLQFLVSFLLLFYFFLLLIENYPDGYVLSLDFLHDIDLHLVLVLLAL